MDKRSDSEVQTLLRLHASEEIPYGFDAAYATSAFLLAARTQTEKNGREGVQFSGELPRGVDHLKKFLELFGVKVTKKIKASWH